METQEKSSPVFSEWNTGSEVVYGMHGKCVIAGIENRTIQGALIPFYKLEVQKSALSRSNKQDPAIWVPVTSAKAQGLRSPMSVEQAKQALALVLDREYFFNPNQPWSSVQRQLESSMRDEGGVGLAKALSFLHVLKRKQIVAQPEVAKMYESVYKMFLRELSEALAEPRRNLEEKIQKALKNKLLPDH